MEFEKLNKIADWESIILWLPLPSKQLCQA